MVGGLKEFFLVLWVVVDHQFERANHSKGPCSSSIQILTDAVFQHAEFNMLLIACDSDPVAEIPK